MFSDLPIDILKQLSNFVRRKQAEKFPLARSNLLVQMAMEKNQDWLMLQDFPELLMPSARTSSVREKTKLSPPGALRPHKSWSSPPVSPLMRPRILSSGPSSHQVSIGEDELFIMDGVDSVPQLNLNSANDPSSTSSEKEKERKDAGDSAASKSTPGWKISAAPR